MTAVELLVEKLTPMNWTKEYMQEYYKDAIQQAKEMEKQHLYNFYIQGGIDCATQADRTVEDYYNETFKNTKE
jgi:hypothetical protein